MIQDHTLRVELPGLHSILHYEELLQSESTRGSGPNCQYQRAVLSELLRSSLTHLVEDEFLLQKVALGGLGSSIRQANPNELYPAKWLTTAIVELQKRGWVVRNDDRFCHLNPKKLKKLVREIRATLAFWQKHLPSTNNESQSTAPSALLKTNGQAEIKLVDSLALLDEVAKYLSTQDIVAVDCEGDLSRGGRIDLIQIASSDYIHIIDLHTLRINGTLDTGLSYLKPLMESRKITKVFHDCRSDSEALFYLHGIRLRQAWDTQIAYALHETLADLGSADIALPSAKSKKRCGLNAMLKALDLPINPHKDKVHKRMDAEPALWITRPLDSQLLEYGAADVAQLLKAKKLLTVMIGEAGNESVYHLSRAHAVWFLDPADQQLAGQGNKSTYASAARVPVGVDLELTFDPETFKPKYRPAPCLTEEEKRTANNMLLTVLHPAEDPDVSTMLSLFPEEIRQEILERCIQRDPSPAVHSRSSSNTEALATEDEEGVEMSTLDTHTEIQECENGVLEVPGPALVSYRWPREVVVDMGRPVIVRFSDGAEELKHEFSVKDALASLAAAKGRLQLEADDNDDLFHGDNRSGISGSLHRISAMRNRSGKVVGLTYRIGRHLEGPSDMLVDILATMCQPPLQLIQSSEGYDHASLLVVGPPGVGKTTMLRDIAKTVADNFRKNVIVVDSSNEIAGDGDIPHHCIGNARRMQVPCKELQHQVMKEAVQNHCPDALIIDEIGTRLEAEAAKVSAQNGVILVGTAHGVSLSSLMLNPELNGLIGGLASTTIGDMAASSTGGRKTKTERRGEPTFSSVIEVLGYNRWRLHKNVKASVDDMLAGKTPCSQLRWLHRGRMRARFEGPINNRNKAGGGSGGGGLLLGDVHWLQQVADLTALLEAEVSPK